MTDLVDDIEALAAGEIARIREAAELPDSLMSMETIERLDGLLNIVVKARKEQRDQRKYVRGMGDEELDSIEQEQHAAKD